MRLTAMKIILALRVGALHRQVGHKTARALTVKTLALSGFNPGVVDADLDAIKAQVERF